jgi:hypothetical protein
MVAVIWLCIDFLNDMHCLIYIGNKDVFLICPEVVVRSFNSRYTVGILPESVNNDAITWSELLFRNLFTCSVVPIELDCVK